MKVIGATTKRATVGAGLSELVRRHRAREVRKLRGTVEWAEDLDDMRGVRTLAT